MNALTKWEPFREMDELQDRLARFFGLSLPRPANPGDEAMTFAEWLPSVDISEDDKEWCVKADLPDVKKEDVTVTVENGVLRLVGERKFEKEEKGRKYHRVECAYGKFLRSFVLPDGADGSKSAAEYKNGVLTVRVPKNEKAKAKAVEVKVS
ncbi:MAG TPA: Hsp20/alpha crystallin family protein [Candidatus Sulfotelmatobacter sp.]|nr:Hsp20/alpha crystallin family protein [Candidatus Sulfotelmatobacter sp.]